MVREKVDYEMRRKVVEQNGRRICGYLREIYFDDETIEVSGLCALTKELVCERGFQRPENCQVAIRYFQEHARPNKFNPDGSIKYGK